MTARFPLTLVAGLALTAVFVAAALLSLVWTPHAVESLNIAARLKPASADHLLGTDHFGRDMLSMLMVGARTSIAVAIVAVGIGMALGVPLGANQPGVMGSIYDISSLDELEGAAVASSNHCCGCTAGMGSS